MRGTSRFLWHGEGPGAFGGELDCVLGGGDGGQSGGKSELGMAKEMDSILHCRFTTLNSSWWESVFSLPNHYSRRLQAIGAGVEDPIPNFEIHGESGPGK